MIRVFYDQNCSLCRLEINFYKKITPKNAIKWVDIKSNPNDVTAIGLTLNQAMRRFYVADDQNHLYIGVDGFIEIWKVLPGWQRVAFLVRLPGLYTLAKCLYALFSWGRYRFHGYHRCNLDQQHNEIKES